MALATLASKIIGSHANFFRDATAFTIPGAGTSGRASKPGAADPVWIDLGIIETAEDKIEEIKEVEIMAPTPGRLQVYDVLSAGAKITLNFTLSEMHYWVLEQIYRTATLTTASTQANPLEGSVKRGWLKFSRYDHTQDPGATALLIADFFVRMKCTGGVIMGGGDVLLRPTFEATMLYSTLNTMSF